MLRYCGPILLLLIHLVPFTSAIYEDSCLLPVNFTGICDQAKESDGRYVHPGTQCYHGNIKFLPIICEHEGIWKEVQGATSTHHHIGKRVAALLVIGIVGAVAAVISTITGVVTCVFICDKKSEPANVPPTLKCPKVHPVFTAADGKTTAKIFWETPEAADKEDNSISAKVTSPVVGYPPGSEFEEGSHYIQYMVTDSGGLRAYCNIQFKVKVNRCDDMQWPRYGRVSCDKRSISGSKCSLSCYEGYKPEDKTVSICNNDTWSAQFHCLPTICKTTPPVENGNVFCMRTITIYKTACYVSCSKGFSVEGASMIVCEANGAFTLPGRCVDSTAPVFPGGCPADITDYAEKNGGVKTVTIENINVTDNSNILPAITFTPPSGYGFPPGRSVVTVTATDDAGNTAKCSFAVIIKTLICDEPDFDKSGKDLLIYDCSDGMQYGDSCNVSCKSGHPLEGSPTIVCNTLQRNYVPPQVHWTVPDDTLQPYCKINPCPDLPAPINGALACDAWNHGKMCQMQCNSLYDVPRSVPEQYVCGESTGQWRPNDIIPDCTVRRKPGSMTMPSKLYYFTGSCPDPDTQQQIKENFINMLKGNVLYKKACDDVPDCRTEFVSVKCGDEFRRRKRSVGKAVEIKFNIIERYQEDEISRFRGIQECERRLMTVGKALSQAVESRSLDIGVPGLELHDNSFKTGIPDFTCEEGTVPVYDTASCAGCPSGTFYNRTTNDCVNCPVGFYADSGFAFSCKPCPENYSTLIYGSKTPYQCIATCEPGSFSSTGMIPCSPCPEGHYQTQNGMTLCTGCPMGQTTVLQGSSQRKECIDFDIHTERDTVIAHSQSVLSSLSVVTWIYLDEITASTVIGFGDNISLTISTGYSVSLGSKNITSEEPATFKEWLHMALVIDTYASIVKLYLNGNDVISETLSEMPTPLVATGAPLQIKTEVGVTVNGLNVLDRALSGLELALVSTTCGVTITESAIVFLHPVPGIQKPSKCDAIDECKSSPCGEHTCINEKDGFTCQCEKGYSGQFCQTPPDHCLHHSCEHGALCVNNYSNYSCMCTEGFKGALCEQEIVKFGMTECRNSPRGEHTCINEKDGFTCQCEKGYSVNGGWGDWGDWGECSVTCGGGIMTRNRKCISPPPDPEGKSCVGSDVMTETCNEKKCPSCTWLPQSEGVIRMCNNVIHDIIVCNITCKEGLVFTEEVLSHYYCGRETNYMWNHQTPDNPTARLPSCTAPKMPEAYTLTHEMEYPSLPCNLDDGQQNQIKEEVLGQTYQLELPCMTDGTCQPSVQLQTCDSGNRNRRATSKSSLTLILTTTKDTSVLVNISVLLQGINKIPEETRGLILKMVHFEMSAQKLINHTSVFTLTVAGTPYIGQTESAKTKVKLDCPQGTTAVEGLCGECPPGFKEVFGHCVQCERGAYQVQPGMTNCDQCPWGKTTTGLGSTSPNDCNIDAENTNAENTMLIVLTTICGVLLLIVMCGVAVWKIRSAKNKKLFALERQDKSVVLNSWNHHLSTNYPSNLC